MPEASAAIVAKNVTKSYKENAVLKGIDLEVAQGTIFALLGPNGAGKTTMVRILTTLLQPDGGTVTVGGYNVLTQPELVQSTIGVAGQYASVDNKLTGTENLAMIGRLYRLSSNSAAKRAEQLIERFDLVEAGNRAVKTYSGGMRRRLDLAASLIVAPPILFLDEPTTGLDPQSRTTMWEIIRDLVKEGTTLLLTTQYLEEADQLADQIAVIDDGRVIAQGTATQLKSQIGGERFDLTLATPEDYKTVHSQFSHQIVASNADDLLISFPAQKGTKGLHELQSLLEKLTASKVSVESYSVHHPTLDDVFLTLTNHPATAEVTEK